MSKKKYVIILIAGLGLVIGADLRAQRTESQAIKLKVTAEHANLRERPDIGSAILQQIPEETILTADRKEGEWYLVHYELEDGGVMAGFIHESLVKVVETARPAQTVRDPQTTITRRDPGRGTQTAGRSESRPSRVRPEPDFRVSLWGAWSRIRPEDLSSGAAGLSAYSAAGLGTVPVGEVDPLRTALALGFEFSFQISPGIYLGAGTGLLRGSEKSLVDYPLEPIPGTFTAKPSVQATPVRISLSFYPLENWYIKGAVGYYFAKTQYFYRMFAGPVDWQEWTGKTTSQGLGAEGSAGAEWDITSNLRLFLEAGYRYAKIKRFVGKEFYSDAGIEDLVTEGTLYFFQKTGPNERIHPLLFVRETLPDEEGVVEAREAQVDFSGAVLRIGIRVRF